MSDFVRALETALGVRAVSTRRLPGGDINDAHAVTLEGGARLFVKTRSEVPEGMYAREAEGLAFLAEARALRVPDVRLASERMLVLELIAQGAPAGDYDERLGRGLAALHRFGAPCFGLARDNYVGSLPQANGPCEDWVTFYGERRLLPLAERARLPAPLQKELAGLVTRLEAYAGPAEPPARLHGDLWSGNVMADERGWPVLIDPAVYGGHREVDLAMLALFGAPSARFYAAYDEVYPREPGADERVALYQLYPLLVHVCLFGGGYVAQLSRALSHYR